MNREPYLEQFQQMVKELPPKLQERIQNEDVAEKLMRLIENDNVFPLIHSLQESQTRTEKNLFNERQRMIKEAKEKEADLVRKHSEDEARCADRPQHLNLLQAANKREYEAFLKRMQDEQQKFDSRIVLDLDQKMLEQQTRLEKIGLPCMFATTKPQDIRLQMFIIEYLQQISKDFPRIKSENDP